MGSIHKLKADGLARICCWQTHSACVDMSLRLWLAGSHNTATVCLFTWVLHSSKNTTHRVVRQKPSEDFLNRIGKVATRLAWIAQVRFSGKSESRSMEPGGRFPCSD